MGYATTTSGARGVVRTNSTMQCLGVSVSRTIATDQQGNVTVLSETRTPIVAKTVETVKEFVGLSATDANGNGPAATSHGETGTDAYLFKPFCKMSVSGSQPFVQYERSVAVVREQGGTHTVTVTERESEIVS